MSPRIFFGVLLVIVIGWFTAGTYTYSQQLEQLVFLDHYIEDYAQDSLHMQFYYITNKGDKNTVNVVELGDIAGFPDGQFDFFMEESSYVQRYGPHELRTINVTFDIYEIRSFKEKQIFNEMTVHTSDGKQFVTDIGEIIIHPPDRDHDRSWMSQMSTGDGKSSVFYLTAEKEMTILGLNPHLPAEGLTGLKVHIPQMDESLDEINFFEKITEELDEGKGEDYRDQEYPIRLEKDDGLVLSIQNEKNVKFILHSWLMIEGEDNNGKALKSMAYLHHIPQLNGKDVKAIIENKGVDK